MPLFTGPFGGPLNAARAARIVAVPSPVKKAVRFPNSDGGIWSYWDKRHLLADKGEIVFPHGSYDTGNSFLNFIGNAFCEGTQKYADGFAVKSDGDTLTVQYVKDCESNLKHYGLAGDRTAIGDSSGKNRSFNIVRQEISVEQFYALADRHFPYCAAIHPSYLAAGRAESVANAAVVVPVAASAIPAAGAAAAGADKGAINSAAADGNVPRPKVG